MPEKDQIEGIAPSRRRVLAAAAGVGAAGLTVGMAAAHEDDDDGSGDDGEDKPSASVEFVNQGSDGTSVVINETRLPKGGYVTVHNPVRYRGELAESVIGVSEPLDAGVHEDVSVPLFDVPGAQFDEDSIEETTPLVAMPHRDTNDNDEYEFVESDGDEDVPYTESGQPVVDAAFVVSGDDPETEDDPVATIAFRNQSATEGTVTVETVTLPDGGFVAIHDVRVQGQPYESVVGVSEYLGPGSHESVAVPIDDANTEGGVDHPVRPLIPMAHRDTNGDEDFDYVETKGDDDGPYTVVGQPVIDAGLVSDTD